jgi:hypothetical protein
MSVTIPYNTNSICPTASYNFLGATALPSWISFSRAGNATYFNSSGNLFYAPNNQIRNNSMSGASAGTPGTLPNNWSIGGLSGLSSSVIGTGTVSQGTYIDLRVFGTTSSSGTAYIQFESLSQVAAVNAQNWISGSYVSLVSGSISNITQIYLAINMQNSGGTYLATLPGSDIKGSLTSTPANFQTQQTLNQATTAYIYPTLNIQFNAGSLAIDVTLRIILPQLSLVTAAQSTITDMPATTSAAYYGPRFDYNPSTLAAKGLLLEGARTNSIRNNTMQGAVAGTARATGSGITISRTASATAVAAMATHNFSVGDLVTITGATGTNASEYNGTFVVSAVVASTSFSYVTSTSRTDSVTGASVSGLSQGTPPTNWVIYFNGVSGLGSSVVGSGTENGINYLEFRVAGLPTGTISQGVQVFVESNTAVPASGSQSWNSSYFLKRSGGTATNVGSFILNIQQLNTGAFVASNNTTIGSITTTLTRYTGTSSFSASTTTAAYPCVAFGVTTGQAIDITLRIGLPQLELLSSFSQTASSAIPTYGSSLTRAADIATITGTPATILASSQGTALVETTQEAATDSANRRLIGSSTQTTLFIIGSGTNIGTGTLFGNTGATWTNQNRAALAWSSGGRSIINTGVAVTTDTTAPTWTSTFYLGSVNGGAPADGWYSRAAFYNIRLPDTMLSDKVKLGAPL